MPEAKQFKVNDVWYDVADTNAREDIVSLSTDLKNNIIYLQNLSMSQATSAQMLRYPASGNDTRISASTIVLECIFQTPSQITSNVTWNTYDGGYLTLTGTCTTAGSKVNLVLGQSGN